MEAGQGRPGLGLSPLLSWWSQILVSTQAWSEEGWWSLMRPHLQQPPVGLRAREQPASCTRWTITKVAGLRGERQGLEPEVPTLPAVPSPGLQEASVHESQLLKITGLFIIPTAAC